MTIHECRISWKEARQEAAILILREIAAIESKPRLARSADDNERIDIEVQAIREWLGRRAGFDVRE